MKIAVGKKNHGRSCKSGFSFIVETKILPGFRCLIAFTKLHYINAFISIILFASVFSIYTQLEPVCKTVCCKMVSDMILIVDSKNGCLAYTVFALNPSSYVYREVVVYYYHVGSVKDIMTVLSQNRVLYLNKLLAFWGDTCSISVP